LSELCSPSKFLSETMDYGEDTLKAEKIFAMKKFKRNRKTKKYLRYAVVAGSAVLLSWSSVWLPVIVKTAGFYFQCACSVVASTKFVFFMCNVIIVTLAVRSGQLGHGGGSNGGSPDLYDEFVKNTENRQKYFVNLEPVEDEPEDKQCVSETEPEVHEKSILPEFNPVETETGAEAMGEVKVTSSKRGKIERSKSENIFATDRAAKRGQKKLQRSETSIQNPQKLSCDSFDEKSCLVVTEIDLPQEPREESESLTNAEFNNKVEAFIANKKKLQREESLALVV